MRLPVLIQLCFVCWCVCLSAHSTQEDKERWQWRVRDSYPVANETANFLNTEMLDDFTTCWHDENDSNDNC